MKHLLVFSRTPALASAVRAAVDPARYRVLHQETNCDELLLTHTSIDACLLDADLTTIEPIRFIQHLRRLMPDCPILIYSAAKQWEWEEEAYLLGVAHILNKPVRGRLLQALLDRLGPCPPVPADAPAANPVVADAKPVEHHGHANKTLEVLRDFSGVLKHTLCSKELLTQFLLLLREVLGVNRAAIFLRKAVGSSATMSAAPKEDHLTATCAIGLATGLLEHFELSLKAGIGGFLHRRGRILQSYSAEAQADREIQKEFELLGAQVAIPILDRESLVGVAIFDSPLTGEVFTKEQLAMIFHLLEELGLAIKNSWLHDQLAANHAMMADILSQLESACVLVGSDLSILHANSIARELFSKSPERLGPLEFSDLPQPVGSQIFQALQSGLALAPFQYRQDHRLYQVTITPFKRPPGANAVLVLLEDFTQHERAQQLEIETAGLRLVKSMAERLAHEIGNAITPLAVHHELLEQRYAEPEFRAALEHALAESVTRISRLARQMFFLARESFERADTIALDDLVKEAFAEAHRFHDGKKGRLVFEAITAGLTVEGDRAGLRHALAEVMLNALQANHLDVQLLVRVREHFDPSGKHWAELELHDQGPGFSPESASHATVPFYTTRAVGIGLGLTVARKIIEKHGGKLSIVPSGRNARNPVGILLPMD
jgi:signal transduction histidine kinase